MRQVWCAFQKGRTPTSMLRMPGELPYAPADVRVPVFVVYGNYDLIVDDAGASAFLQRFTASPLKWRMRIDDGTHVMHLDRTRRSLYESVAAFVRVAEAP
jgi:esterase/lipase